MRIDYDDQPDIVVEKCNKELEKFGLHFEADEIIHDGYMLYELVEDDKRISGAS